MLEKQLRLPLPLPLPLGVLLLKLLELLLLLLLLLLAGGESACACTPLSFDGMFLNGAVLQKDAPVAIYGHGEPGSLVQLSLDGAPVAHGNTDAHGRWEVTVPPQPSSWGRTLAVSDGSAMDPVTTVVKVGAVILCSGQSNMGMPVAHWDPCCDVPPAARDPERRCSCFAANNGTAESAAAGQYTGKISLATLATPFPKPIGWRGDNCRYPWTNSSCVSHPTWNDALPGPNGTVHGFSAVCWYTGRHLFDQLNGEVPIGLMCGAVGGSPIEFWLPPGHVNSSVCGLDTPACDPGGPNNYTDSEFFERLIAFFQPYTIGAVVWDQAERDVHCLPQAAVAAPENETGRYACMERELVRSWRAGFKSQFAFTAIQLPGYLGDCGTFRQCMANLLPMRLAQDAPLLDDPSAAVTATYDQGCPFGVATSTCPFGSVHNVNKAPIGARVATQLRRLMLKQNIVSEGPRASYITSRRLSAVEGGGSEVTVSFKGGSRPYYQHGTENCARCCQWSVGQPATNASSNDYDASGDNGLSFVNGSAAVLTDALDSLVFTVPALDHVTHVRYTGNQPFPQCALYNREGLPALPFWKSVDEYVP